MGKQCAEGFDKRTKDGLDTNDTFLSQADVAQLSAFLCRTLDTACAMFRLCTSTMVRWCMCQLDGSIRSRTLQDGVKIAWDMVMPERMVAYMVTLQHTLSRIIRSSAPDYIAIAGILWAALSDQPDIICVKLLR